MKKSKEIDNVYNEEDNSTHIPNDGLEEIDIEPIDWDCI